MQSKAVVDRLEGNKAVLLLGDQEVQVVWPCEKLPSEVQEGDVLQIDVRIDDEATSAAKMAAKVLLTQILAKNQEG